MKYNQKIIEKVNAEEKQYVPNEEKWMLGVVNICKEAGREVLGEKEKHSKTPENKELRNLSDRKQNLLNNIKGCSSQEARSKMKTEANNIKYQIKNKLKEKEEQEMDTKLKKIELIKDDNTKYFYALRSLQNAKSTKKHQ